LPSMQTWLFAISFHLKTHCHSSSLKTHGFICWIIQFIVPKIYNGNGVLCCLQILSLLFSKGWMILTHSFWIIQALQKAPFSRCFTWFIHSTFDHVPLLLVMVV
jgi:hypothetical protein